MKKCGDAIPQDLPRQSCGNITQESWIAISQHNMCRNSKRPKGVITTVLGMSSPPHRMLIVTAHQVYFRKN